MDEKLKLWKDFTAEDWLNASYCESCGLPLMQSEPDENGVSETFCVYCTWKEDDKVIGNSNLRRMNARIAELESELAVLKESLKWRSIDELPAEKGQYLVQHKEGFITGKFYFDVGFYSVLNKKFLGFDSLPLVGWMPLPQPMEEEK